jgi:colanic acid/amylovoran biosynthesis protein
MWKRQIMTNILLINTNCSVNKGSAAQVISTVETLNKFILNPNFVMWSWIPELDSKPCGEHGIKVIGSSRKKPFSKGAYYLMFFELLGYVVRCAFWAGLDKIGLKIDKVINSEILTEYCASDLIVDLSGDSLSDYGWYSIYPILAILTGIILRKKIAVFSQSLGPFKKTMTPLVRFCLDRVGLIVVREDETLNILRRINVDNPHIYLLAEIAFLLESAPPDRIQKMLLKEGIGSNGKEDCPLIGVGPSLQEYDSFKSKNEFYVSLMAKITDYLVEKTNAEIILIPHLIIPPEYHHEDDRSVARKIYQTAKNKNRIKLIKNDYSPEELKGLIGKCELFIGTRMHSNIASTSMHVPTIALAWSHKYHGIMKMLDQEKYVCDVKTTNLNKLILIINDAWRNRNEIRKQLASKTGELQKSALFGGRLVGELLMCRPSKFSEEQWRK